jgi:hypothetical protein
MTTSPAPVASAAGVFAVSSRLDQQRQMFVYSNTVQYLYYPFEDAFIQIPSAALAGTFGAGACGTTGSVGPTGTATAGTTTTLTTNLTLARNLAGYQIHITSGPGAGDIRTIRYNSVGTNAVIEVTSAFSATITASSTYRLLTPRWYILGAGTLASGSFRMYCFALNTWTTLSIVGLPATWATDGRMVATPSIGDAGDPTNFASGTATSATSTTLVNTSKTWTVNSWANYQVRITAGTGVGQIRIITSNTSNTLTVPTWTTTPDATSQYAIEGNDDYIYLMGNGAVTLYRYSISGGTWVTLSPSAARAGAPSTGMSGNWVFSSTDPRWTDESVGINGQRIYSFRGGATTTLDYYDIALNTWVSAVPYAPATETFTTGTKYIYATGELYIQKDATGRWFKYNFADQAMIGWSTNVYPSGAAVLGDTAFDVVEPTTGVRFIMYQLNTSTVVMRCMVV